MLTDSDQTIPDGITPLTDFARQLAETHTLTKHHLKKTTFLKQMPDWQSSLRKANAVFKAQPINDQPLSRAGEWVLDNFYILKQNFHQIEEGLPDGFFNELPQLKTGLPRILTVAWEWIGYTHGQLDLTQTATFVQEYQQIAPLTIGELWALPNMLRIGILERLVHAVCELTGLEVPKGLRVIPPQPVSLPNEMIVANCFISLRLLAASNWKVFFEQTSRVEQILCTDPAGIYIEMDFETRNRYRGVIEELARHTRLFTEEQVALAAIALAQAANPDSKQAHIGFHLLGAGRRTLETRLNYQPGIRLQFRRALLSAPTSVYLGSIAVISLLILLGLLSYTYFAGGSPVQMTVVAVLGFGLALESAIALVHWHVTHDIRPQSLPRMDFSEGIPPGHRAMVVVPTLLESADDLKHLLQELELYSLSNPDKQLTYALLTDFSDAPAQLMPGDEDLLALACSGVVDLNHKYSARSPFYLFHRQREWNQSEGMWMGWERKRGKLAEFNHLLLNPQAASTYTTQIGDLSILANIKYVITLDADTSLPQGSANRLVATLAHPLNRAEFSADGRSVVGGYTVLQPRVAIKPTSANRSPFSQIFAGNAGFDLYSFAISDVYQDLFGEGSYVGKGIYDVDAFERSLTGQVRENTLLSHDLFEGIHGRAALVTDIILYEEYPSHYLAYARRLSRWIRGDWQLLPWLFPLVRTENGIVPNRLSTINLWKLFDNLRRSLLPPTLLALLAAGWIFLPGSPLVWTLLVLLPAAFPIAAQTVQNVQHRLGKWSLAQFVESVRQPLIRWGLAIIFLPYEALLMVTAIITTLKRLFITRRHLLQWTTAATLARMTANNPRGEIWYEMSGALALTLLLGLATAMFNPQALWVALPVLAAWFVAPQIAFVISQPLTHTPKPLSIPQRKQVSRLARRTWAFFEQFTGPEDHWLPPDHFQESPHARVAHYTTPTNIGLFLVSTLAAYDLGYIGLLELAVRLRSTFESMDKLEHYRGHLMNWYDSQTQMALPPRYISSVDSGNLAASLITLRQGLLALTDAPLLSNKQWDGLLALLDILSEALQSLEKNNPDADIESFEVELSYIYKRISVLQNQPSNWRMTLVWLIGEGWQQVSRRLIELLESHPHLQVEALAELQLYLDLLHHHLQDMQRSLDTFAPWLGHLDSDLLQTPAGREFLASLPTTLPTVGTATAVYRQIQTALTHFQSQDTSPATQEWCQKLDAEITSARLTVTPLLIGFHDLADQANAIVKGMDFRFLFNERRQVFHIGYNVSTEQLDPSYYDLLASEARITSLIAIAKGDIPQSHWQHLGRPITQIHGRQVLLSWSGTMFEYLMPTLFVKNYAGTFLYDSCYMALDAQVAYGNEQKIPWGISESGYFAFDLNQNYQYHAFGVPNLGYQRGLLTDRVMTPYASLLGLSLQPQAVLENMTHLEKRNMLGRFGFYEALDTTPTRLHDGQTQAIVQSYMAHHQGMILLAACNYLLDDCMVERFHADEHIHSVELLLQEKIPQDAPLEFPHHDEVVVSSQTARISHSNPWSTPVESAIPLVHTLSMGDASLMITNAGSGYSQWREFALTRWQADGTLDASGTWIYLQDRESGARWSATCQPFGGTSNQQEVLFYPHKVEFRRYDQGISLSTEVSIGVGEVELRRVSLLNDTDRPRKLKLTSYGEVALALQAADRRHPAFNKLFIESEYLPEQNALLFQRRPRSADEKPLVLIHAIVIEAGLKYTGEHESDRAQFLGRAQTLRTPLALSGIQRGGVGQVGRRGTLDPIFSLGQEINLKAHARTRVTFITLAAPTRAEALEKLSHFQSGQAIHRAVSEARSQRERELLEMGLDTYMLENIQRLLSALLYPTGALRAAPHLLAQNEKGQSGLWGFGISGDFPILLVRIYDGESSLLTESLQAFTYWRKRHVTVNLVILNDQDTGYALDLHNSIRRQIQRMGADSLVNQREGIFILRADQLQTTDKILLQTVAGVILDEKTGNLADHASRLLTQPARLPAFIPSMALNRDSQSTPQLPIHTDLCMENGLGGFSPDGREYVIHLLSGQRTPLPWVNVIANPQFGFLVSEAGSGCTWAVNSGENRLTPWRNDPVSDVPGEVIYLRDEETGQVWSPTLLPAGADTTHIIHHGAGYSIFESQSHGLNQTLRLFAAPAAPVKIAHLRLQNLWDRPRRVTVTYYAEWLLGTTRDIHQPHIMPEFDPQRHALFASNRFNSEFGERVAFLAANKKPHGVTADRTEFLGRLGDLRHPAALARIGLGSAVNAGLDPCAALQLHVDLAPGAFEEVYFLLGQGANRAESLAVIDQLQVDGQVEDTWQAVHRHWDDILSTITVETPDPAMDLMLNRWLLYQTLSCRLWGRTALYQSSGAFGFRDQLQDVMALLHARPDIARAQILEAARHQFDAGDVLHWWNPPAGRGVRTRFSDDLLWLPFVTAEYVNATGDLSILNEQIPFLQGEALKAGEDERYTQFETANNWLYSLGEHCRRALEKGTTFGAHNLPLMGAGDWNDGMNRVGIEGRGESIWLGWFLHATLTRFAPLTENPALYLQQAESLAYALDSQAWDGDWYLRAFYDDGSKLGSRDNNECRIDAIAQSWAVLSGAANPQRALQAMESVYRLLVKPEEQMILLFTPPFDKTPHDPGYIKGYLPGVRENGGQYTHAAIWTAWAFAKLGDGNRAGELFQLLNPISHADTSVKAVRYKVEPYVIAADVYSRPPLTGRGGWTWYTGSSGWMYRLGMEAILGISRVGTALQIAPCIPGAWPGFKVNYRYKKTQYTIRVENPDRVQRGIRQMQLDGHLLPGNLLPLLDDGLPHDVQVVMG